MSCSRDYTKENILERFGIMCPVDICLECSQDDMSEEDMKAVIQNYCDYHICSEEKISAADAFWKKFHSYITEAKENQMDCPEFVLWEDACQRMEMCQRSFLDMKHSRGITVHHLEIAKAA